jgi:Abnormal spindle-like microcephaly-assoc'd, ASPM-SPD-2-Hydin
MKFLLSVGRFSFGEKSESNSRRNAKNNCRFGSLGAIAILWAVMSPALGAAATSPLIPNRDSLSFGNVVIRTAGEQSITLTNGGHSSVTILKVVVAGTNFTESGLTLPLTIPAGQNSAFMVHFAPTTVGAFRGVITIESNASNPLMTIIATGSATTQISTDSPIIYFPGVAIGSNQQHTIWLTNNGQTSVTISKVLVSGTGFSEIGLVAPRTIPARQKIALSEYFIPKVASEVKGTITIYSNASDPVLTIASIGVGMQQISVSPAVAFGEVALGGLAQHAITVTNHGNMSVKISKCTVSGASFKQAGLVAPATIAARGSLTFSAYFVPAVAGEVGGAVTIASNGSDPSVTVTLTGIGVASTGHLAAVPASALFEKVALGDTNSQSITLSNSSLRSIIISQAEVSGKGFRIAGLADSLTIPAGRNFTFTVMFTPAIAGTATGSLSLVSNAANSQLMIPLAGTAVAASMLLEASPAALNFEKMDVGTGGSLEVTLTNKGNSKVTIASLRVSGAEYSQTGVVSGVALAPAQSTTVKIVFKPTATGSAAGSVSISSNATNSPTTIPLLGTAVTKVPHSVDLAWSASSSPKVVGYDVYRGTSYDGPFTKLTLGALSVLKYVDSSVEGGQTYYYVVTSKDSAGIESLFSNEALAHIPEP